MTDHTYFGIVRCGDGGYELNRTAFLAKHNDHMTVVNGGLNFHRSPMWSGCISNDNTAAYDVLGLIVDGLNKGEIDEETSGVALGVLFPI